MLCNPRSILGVESSVCFELQKLCETYEDPFPSSKNGVNSVGKGSSLADVGNIKWSLTKQKNSEG